MQSWKDVLNLRVFRSISFKKGAALNAPYRLTSRPLRFQAAQAAKTVSVTLTAAEILAGLITGNQGGAAAASYTLPLGADVETLLFATYGQLAVNDSFDFSLINISVVAAEDITVLTAAGWTLVGSMVVEAREATQVQMSQALFRVRRTGAGTYTLYRLA